jgi:hypothetical protein
VVGARSLGGLLVLVDCTSFFRTVY